MNIRSSLKRSCTFPEEGTQTSYNVLISSRKVKGTVGCPRGPVEPKGLVEPKGSVEPKGCLEPKGPVEPNEPVWTRGARGTGPSRHRLSP